MKILLNLAYKNIKRNWKHSLAAIVSIASAFISLVMFQGYMDDVERLYLETFSNTKMYGDLIIENSKFETVEGKENPLQFSITKSDQAQIDHFLKLNSIDIDTSVRFLNINGMITNGNESTIFEGRGFDLEAGLKMRGSRFAYDTIYGVPLLNSKNSNSIHVGYNLAKLLSCDEFDNKEQIDIYSGNLNIERPFKCKSFLMQLNSNTEHEQLNALDLTLVGIVDANYKEVDNKFVQISLENAQKLLDTDKISYYTVRLNKNSNLLNFTDKFKVFSTQNNLNLKMIPWIKHKVGDMYLRTMDFLTIFRNFIVAIILFIAGLSIFNSLVKIINERTREVGTLRSLGFSKNDILKIFLFESFLLSSFGLLIGGISSFLLSIVINFLGIKYKAGVLTSPVPFKILLSFPLCFYSVLIVLFLVLITTYLILKKELKLKIIENLTHV